MWTVQMASETQNALKVAPLKSLLCGNSTRPYIARIWDEERSFCLLGSSSWDRGGYILLITSSKYHLYPALHIFFPPYIKALGEWQTILTHFSILSPLVLGIYGVSEFDFWIKKRTLTWKLWMFVLYTLTLFFLPPLPLSSMRGLGGTILSWIGNTGICSVSREEIYYTQSSSGILHYALPSSQLLLGSDVDMPQWCLSLSNWIGFCQLIGCWSYLGSFVSVHMYCLYSFL